MAERVARGKVTIVAGSMGGFFAIAFAADHPERVRHLILTGCCGSERERRAVAANVTTSRFADDS